jgi:hypothetical protein
VPNKRMVRPMRITLFILLVGMLVSAGSASDCDGTASDLLSRIESFQPETETGELAQMVKCLYAPAAYYVEEYDFFASEEILKEIGRETDQNRLRAIKVLIPLTRSEDWLLAQESSAALAYYGYSPGRQLLADYPDTPIKAVLYSILGYEQSIRWGIDQFNRAERESKPDSLNLAAKMTYLNLLYHLAAPASLPFVNGLISSSQSEIIRARAKLIRQRVIALHPELE